MGNTRAAQKLALHGSLKAVTRIEGKGKPKIGPDEFMALAERFGLSKNALKQIRGIVDAEDWGAGPFLGNYYSGLKETRVQVFERLACKTFNMPYAIATSSGTGALHSAMIAAGVGPGKEVICSAIGFFATAAAVVAAKGIPIFCDVDTSLSMDPRKIAPLITKRTVAIAPTHVLGTVCDMGSIMKIARKHKLRVIEDCAQSCGGQFRGKRVGSFGDLGCFSISSYKICGGGEGGLLLAKEKRLWETASQQSECGGLWRPDRFAPPRYPHELFCGTNYRMSELEAAVDVVQLKRLPGTVRRSNTVKTRILKQLKTFREIIPQKLNDVPGDVGYVLRFYPENVALAEKIYAALNAEGVSCGTRGSTPSPDWHIYHDMYPIMLQSGPTGPECAYQCPHYTQNGGSIRYPKGNCPIADDLFARVVNINLNQWYTPRDCAGIAKGINKVLAAYCTQDPNATPWL